MTNSPALADLRVLDFTRLLPGPFCTCVLADLGADVVKIEDPLGGDYLRRMPPVVKETGANFLAVNRNKRSVVLDLRHEAGRETLLRLMDRFDVAVEGFRPGVMDRLGVGYAALRARQPRLIFASLSGYGQDGPYRERAGHDVNYCALAGGAGLTGNRDGRLAIPGHQPADLSAALYAAMSILAAVVRRKRTGEGCFIDISLTDCARALNVLQFQEYLQSNYVPGPADHIFSGRYVCYNLYRTKDGRHMSLGALEPKFWLEFCRAVGKTHLETDGFALADEGAPVKRELDEMFAARTQAEWIEFFARFDCCCEPVLRLDEAAAHPLARQRGVIREAVHPTEGPLRQLTQPMRFDPPAEGEQRPAPALGQHNREVLSEAGMSEDEIIALQQRGAFGSAR